MSSVKAPSENESTQEGETGRDALGAEELDAVLVSEENANRKALPTIVSEQDVNTVTSLGSEEVKSNQSGSLGVGEKATMDLQPIGQHDHDTKQGQDSIVGDVSIGVEELKSESIGDNLKENSTTKKEIEKDNGKEDAGEENHTSSHTIDAPDIMARTEAETAPLVATTSTASFEENAKNNSEEDGDAGKENHIVSSAENAKDITAHTTETATTTTAAPDNGKGHEEVDEERRQTPSANVEHAEGTSDIVVYTSTEAAPAVADVKQPEDSKDIEAAPTTLAAPFEENSKEVEGASEEIAPVMHPEDSSDIVEPATAENVDNAGKEHEESQYVAPLPETNMEEAAPLADTFLTAPVEEKVDNKGTETKDAGEQTQVDSLASTKLPEDALDIITQTAAEAAPLVATAPLEEKATNNGQEEAEENRFDPLANARSTEDVPDMALTAADAAPVVATGEDEHSSELKEADVTSNTMSGDSEEEDGIFQEIPLKDAGDETASETKKAKSLSVKWASFVLWLHQPIQAVLKVLTQVAARNPVGCILFVICLSALLLAGGITTNIYLETDLNEMWSPEGSPSRAYAEWGETAGFRSHRAGRPFRMVFHQDGDNVLFKSAIARVFEIVEEVQDLKAFRDSCVKIKKGVERNKCTWSGVTEYWNNDPATFRSQIPHQDIIEVLSNRSFPNGFDAEETSIYGRPQRDENDMLVSATAFVVTMYNEGSGDKDKTEKKMLDHILEKRDKWEADRNGFRFRVEAMLNSSLGDESLRAVWGDIHLIPIVFGFMCLFATFFFARWNAVRSRALLGICAVISIMLALISGYGLLMCIGVPITALTQMIVFAVFGIGLDDTFILMGSFEQTDPNKKIHVRVEEAINEIGVSITLTTLTTSIAFALGTISDVPAVDWLCLYAFPIIIFEFLFQITFFVACLVLDERRMQDGRYDCLVCKKKNTTESGHTQSNSSNDRQVMYQKAMRKYGNFLLHPVVKIVTCCLFLGLFIACLFSALDIRQDFSVSWLLPDDSYMIGYLDAQEKYGSANLFVTNAVFRDVDQSDPQIQDQMFQFVDELVAMDSVGYYPGRFWLKDFLEFVEEDPLRPYASFESNLWAFLQLPENVDRYRGVLAGSEATGLSASRVEFHFSNVPEDDVKAQINAMKEQRAVSARQPANQGKHVNDYAFFVYSGELEFWEFNLVAINELILTTVVALAVMSVITIMFVPHWSAVFFVLPLVSVLYVDVVGVLNWAGISLNAVTYVVMVISIGLLVDYVLHLIIRYYECEGDRRERSIKTLETLGISIVVGGTTTFLGILPLAFSVNSVFHTIFVSFLSLVLLGVGHATILLPIILATFGPQDIVIITNEDGTKSVAPAEREPRVAVPSPNEEKHAEEEEEEEEEEDGQTGSYFQDEASLTERKDLETTSLE